MQRGSRSPHLDCLARIALWGLQCHDLGSEAPDLELVGLCCPQEAANRMVVLGRLVLDGMAASEAAVCVRSVRALARITTLHDPIAPQSDYLRRRIIAVARVKGYLV